MPRPMTKYKSIQTPKAPQHSFSDIRGGRKAYHKYGKLATYANVKQADEKVVSLRLLGFDCYRTYDWPFLILLNQPSK
jgi:hypothetical protein